MRLGYVVLSALIGLGGVIFSDRSAQIAPSAPADEAGPASDPSSDRVRIETQIVQIPVIPSSKATSPKLKKAAVRRSISAPVVTTRLARSTSNKRDPFLTRAVQRIVGDGRHTPQPFPRPGR
jgi:hypothetical protein